MTNTVTEDIESLIPRLRSYAKAMTRNPDRADDLVQTCLEKAIRNLDQFTIGTNLRAWLFTILRNAHINEVRRQARWADSIDSTACEDLLAVSPNQESRVEFSDFKRAYRRLSSHDRRVLSLVGAQGVSYQDAARRLDVPIGTVRSRLSRARARLRDMMDGTAEPNGTAGGTPVPVLH